MWLVRAFLTFLFFGILGFGWSSLTKKSEVMRFVFVDLFRRSLDGPFDNNILLFVCFCFRNYQLSAFMVCVLITKFPLFLKVCKILSAQPINWEILKQLRNAFYNRCVIRFPFTIFNEFN